jgi:pilus assembly protein Flp/PilA
MESIMFLSTYIKAKLFLEKFKDDERGVTAIEYAIIGVAIAAIVGVMFSSGGTFQAALTGAVASIVAAINGAG